MDIEVDGVHRAMASSAELRLQHTIWMINFFTIKQFLMQKACEKAPMEIDGTQFTTLAELSQYVWIS